jgi:hypothetical protein
LYAGNLSWAGVPVLADACSEYGSVVRPRRNMASHPEIGIVYAGGKKATMTYNFLRLLFGCANFREEGGRILIKMSGAADYGKEGGFY